MGEDGALVRFDLLGPLRAWRADTELELGASKQRAVLAVLLLGQGSPVSTERIVDAVWPEEPPENGANTVQKYVAGLRRVLEPERSPRSPARLLVRTDAGYRILVEPGCLDTDRLADLVRQAREARDEGDLPKADSVLREALQLSRGEPLAGLRGPVFESARRNLVEDVVGSRELLAEVGLAAGRHRELVPELARLVADFPLREEPRALLMLALYRSGRQAEALEAYREAHRFLADELGVEPGERLRDLHARMLAADPDRTLQPPNARHPADLPGDASGPVEAVGLSLPGAQPPAPQPVDWSAPHTWAPRPSPAYSWPTEQFAYPWVSPAPRDGAAIGWRRLLRALLIALIPVASTGLATFIVIGWFAAWRRSWHLWFSTAGYLALVIVFFSIFDPDAPEGPDALVGVLAWLTGWIGGTIHVLLLALNLRRPAKRSPAAQYFTPV
jgi:DNA-binding SARP family transcriptional activator